MADEPHPNAVPAQDPGHFVIDPARDPDAIKSTVYGLHSVKCAAVALFNELGPGIRRGGDECRKVRKPCVSLLGFGSGKRSRSVDFIFSYNKAVNCEDGGDCKGKSVREGRGLGERYSSTFPRRRILGVVVVVVVEEEAMLGGCKSQEVASLQKSSV